MSLYKPLHLLFGEYVFETDAKSFSRLANVLTEKKLSFWNSIVSEGRVRFRASLFSAEEIADTAKELSAPLEIVGKIGLPFVFSRYRKRYGLIVGLFLALFLTFFSQLFIWKINVTGNTQMTTAEIEYALSECGIEVGSFIPYIDVLEEANRLLMNCDGLSSAAISINGTHLELAVLERTPLPDIVDTGGYYNVVASRDGVILDIDADDGTPEVGEGDIVLEGELLINSFMEGNYGSYRPTHARGTVYAAVNESFVTEIPLSRTTKHYTGNTETKTVYYLLGKELPSFSGLETEYEYFDAVSSENWVELFGFIGLPLKQYRVTYNEYIPVTEPISVTFAELLARTELSDYLKNSGLEVLECETEFTADEEKGVCKLTANAVLKQNIAKEVPFDLNQSISERLPKALE